MAEETEIIKWLEKNMDECLIYKNPEINKTAVKQIIKSGETIPGIIIDKNVNLQIK